MSPTLIFREDPELQESKIFMALGASGGPKIISAVLNVIINHAWLGMPLFDAIIHPRVHDQLLYHGYPTTTIEATPLNENVWIKLSERTKAALEKRGHKLLPVDYMGTVQAVAVDLETDTLTAVSDIRKYGAPAGY